MGCDNLFDIDCLCNYILINASYKFYKGIPFSNVVKIIFTKDTIKSYEHLKRKSKNNIIDFDTYTNKFIPNLKNRLIYIYKKLLCDFNKSERMDEYTPGCKYCTEYIENYNYNVNQLNNLINMLYSYLLIIK